MNAKTLALLFPGRASRSKVPVICTPLQEALRYQLTALEALPGVKEAGLTHVG